MLQFLMMGCFLGLSAGFAPGPLLALVISETLKHGMRAGLKVALAPLFTDAPIVALSLLLLGQLSQLPAVLGGISLLGGGVIFYLGYECIRTRGANPEYRESHPRPFLKGILVNALSPHPYLFWIGVGAPTVMNAQKQGTVAAVAFVGGFYAFLVGSKVVLAIVTGKSRAFLKGRVYVSILRILGILLFAFAAMLLYDGLERLGVIERLW